MNKDWYDISKGCFLGAVIGMATTVFLTPQWLWLGLIVGSLAGYVFCGLKEVLAEVPRAVRNTSENVYEWLAVVLVQTKDLIIRPHPFVLLYIVITAFVISMGIFLYKDVGRVRFVDVGILSWVVGTVLYLLTVAISLHYAVGPEKGQKNVFWIGHDGRLGIKFHIKDIISFDARKIQPTYRAIYGLIAFGIGIALKKFISAFIWFISKGFWKFVGHLFVAIHSRKRVMCAVDAPLGMLTAFALIHFWSRAEPESLTTAENILFTLTGGVIALAIGLINCELVAKKVLRLQPV